MRSRQLRRSRAEAALKLRRSRAEGALKLRRSRTEAVLWRGRRLPFAPKPAFLALTGLPDIISGTDLKAQFEAEGFKLLEFCDLVDEIARHRALTGLPDIISGTDLKAQLCHCVLYVQNPSVRSTAARYYADLARGFHARADGGGVDAAQKLVGCS